MKPLFAATFLLILAARRLVAAEPESLTFTRLPGNPIIRPEMMPKDDGEWSGITRGLARR